MNLTNGGTIEIPGDPPATPELRSLSSPTNSPLLESSDSQIPDRLSSYDHLSARNPLNNHDPLSSPYAALGGHGGARSAPIYYPMIGDKKFVDKITRKKEYFIHKIEKDVHDENYKLFNGQYIANSEIDLMPHQKFARSFINPETPYTTGLLFHDTGTGKTLSAIAIAEGFKDHILNLRKIGKSSWVYIVAETAAQNRFFDELIGKGLKGEYASPEESDEYFRLQKIPEADRGEVISSRLKELKRLFYSRIKGYKNNGIYRFVTFREFQNHTIGRRNKDEGRTQVDENGQIIRLAVTDEIKNLNNSVLIIDEAHRTEGNDWMVSIRDVLSRSRNTRIILMTATPMYHTATEIVEILALLAGKQLDKNDIFTKENALRKGGIEKIKEYARGRILYLRGRDPEKFPKVLEMGELPPRGLKLIKTNNDAVNSYRMVHTKIIRVPMSKFHLKTYNEFDGKLSSETRMLTDIVLPTPKSDLGFFEKFGIGEIARASDKWKKEYRIGVYKDSEHTQRLTGDIFLRKNIAEYSAKYARILDDLFAAKGKVIIYEELIEGLGINLFTEILIINGYTPIKGTLVSGVTSVTKESQRCYHCGGLLAKKHKHTDHTCAPAYFAVLIGTGESKNRQEQILGKYNDINNISGKDIKIILGSSVIKESIDFKDLRHMMIINYQHNFSSIKQIEGRGARNYSHARLPPNERTLSVYKYVSVTGNNEESLEELKYRKEEYEHTIIQQVARALKEVSVDCELNRSNNFAKGDKENSAECDYTSCDYACESSTTTKELTHKTIDADTYFKHEKYTRMQLIEYIKKLFTIDVVFDIPTIIELIKKSNKFPLIIDPFIMDTLLQFISEGYTFTNGYGTEGYLITINNYILFQPSGQSESISIAERRIPSKAQDRFFISLTSFIETNVVRSDYSEGSLKELAASLEKMVTRAEVAKALGEYNVSLQMQALETAIEQLATESPKRMDFRFTEESAIKILSHFNKYLISNEKLLKSEEEYTNYNFKLPPELPKSIIGHHFNGKIHCFHDGKWSKCKDPIPPPEQKFMIDNDYIVGYIGRNKIGKIVFKLKFHKRIARRSQKK